MTLLVLQDDMPNNFCVVAALEEDLFSFFKIIIFFGLLVLVWETLNLF